MEKCSFALLAGASYPELASQPIPPAAPVLSPRPVSAGGLRFSPKDAIFRGS